MNLSPGGVHTHCKGRTGRRETQLSRLKASLSAACSAPQCKLTNCRCCCCQRVKINGTHVIIINSERERLVQKEKRNGANFTPTAECDLNFYLCAPLAHTFSLANAAAESEKGVATRPICMPLICIHYSGGWKNNANLEFQTHARAFFCLFIFPLKAQRAHLGLVYANLRLL